MSLCYNDIFIYVTAKISTSHVLDKDFLHDIAVNENATYVYLGANGSVIVNLGAVGSSWDKIQGTLRSNGFDSGRLPGLLRIFQALVEQNILCVEFSDDHPKLRWADWFTTNTNIHIKPLAYGAKLYSHNQLPQGQKKQATDLMKLITDETLNREIFVVIGDGKVINTENTEDFPQPIAEDINKDYDHLIKTSTGQHLVVKVNSSSRTVDVGILLNFYYP